MKYTLLTGLALVVVLIAGAFLVLPTAVQADDQTDAGLAKLGRAVAGTQGKLAAAIKKAETKGIPFGATIEMEDGRTVYEVFVYVAGDTARVLEVEIDAATGEILEVEDADDDEDDEDDDEGHEDDEDGDD